MPHPLWRTPIDRLTEGNNAVLIFNPMTPSGAMELDQLTLAFKGRHRHLEKRFAVDYFKSNLSHLRLCHWLTVIFYSLPGLLDAGFFPEMKSRSNPFNQVSS